MPGEMPPLSSEKLRATHETASSRTASNPYFRMLALLSAFLVALGLILLLTGEVSTGGILLGVGFSAIVAVLVTGAITWQIRQAARSRD